MPVMRIQVPRQSDAADARQKVSQFVAPRLDWFPVPAPYCTCKRASAIERSSGWLRALRSSAAVRTQTATVQPTSVHTLSTDRGRRTNPRSCNAPRRSWTNDTWNQTCSRPIRG
jgi:hypothetical protein